MRHPTPVMIEAEPAIAAVRDVAAPVLSVRRLSVEFPGEQGGRVRAVREISYEVAPGEILAIVGGIGLGQVGGRAGGDGPAATADRRACGRRVVRGPQPADAGQGRHAGAARRWHRHDLSRPDDGAEPSDDRGRPDHRAVAPAPGLEPAAGPATRAGTAGPGGHPRCRQPAAAVPAPVLGRHAPTGDDRHRPVVQPPPADRRRAHHGPGRHHPGADPRADRRSLQQAARASRSSSSPTTSASSPAYCRPRRW